MATREIRRVGTRVAGVRRAVPAIVGLAALALASCKLDLFTLSPAISFSVQSPYTSAQISIGYNVPSDGNLFNSGGSTVTLVTLAKHIAGTYMPIQRYQSGSSGSGNLYFDLNQILSGSGQGFSSYVPVDGTYRISMQVISNGKAVPGYSGEKTFTVDTSGGNPSITEVSPGMVSTTGATTYTITGFNFSTSMSLTVTSNGGGAVAVSSIPALTTATRMSATVNFTAIPTAIPSYLVFTVSNGTVSSIFNVLVGGTPPGITSLVPPSALGAGNTNQIIVLSGSFLSPFTQVTVTDSKGNSVPLFANILQGQVTSGSAPTYPIVTTAGAIPIYANLTGAATGPATVTVTNPDGLSASTTFTIN